MYDCGQLSISKYYIAYIRNIYIRRMHLQWFVCSNGWRHPQWSHQKLTHSQQQFSILHPLSIRIAAASDADAADGARPEIHWWHTHQPNILAPCEPHILTLWLLSSSTPGNPSLNFSHCEKKVASGLAFESRSQKPWQWAASLLL